MVIGITPNLEDDNASTNVSISDNDNDEFSAVVYDEHQAKTNLGTKSKINFQEASHLEKRKIKLMEERLMKKSHANEDYTCLMSITPAIEERKKKKKKTRTTFKVWNSE